MRIDHLKQLNSRLLLWFDKNKRALPWREDPSWYKTYLSEIILQQTTVDQGLPYFNKFLKQFPDVETLASSDEQEILLHWAGLGYYSRARNMLKSAKDIVDKFNSIFPKTYNEALSLPGIGPYSASAILSIAFGQTYPVVDGNVIRVISRLLAIKEDTRKTSTLKTINEKAKLFLDKNNPGQFNEAMMELGATVCSPQNPNCSNCPLISFCLGYKKELVNQIPFKSKLSPKHKKFQVAGILKHGNEICIARKPSKGLLAGMWEFPSLEMNKNQFNNGYANLFSWEFKIKGEGKTTSREMDHTYSHIYLTFKAIIYFLSTKEIDWKSYQDIKWISILEINNYAIHNAHKKLLEWYLKLQG